MRLPRLFQRAADRGGGQADADAAVLSLVRGEIARADDRARGNADRPRAGADEQGVLREFGLRGERHGHQDGLVFQQRARPDNEEEADRAGEGLSRHHAGVREPHRAAGQPSQLRRAAARLRPHDDAASLPPGPARRDRGSLRDPLRRGTGKADPRRGAGHGCGDVGGARARRRRRDRAAAHLLRKDPGGAEEIRRAVRRRRGDLRLLAHRQLLGQPDDGPATGHPGLREGPLVRVSADQRRDGQRAGVPGARRRKPQDRHVRHRLHLLGPPGPGGRRRRDAEDL